MIDYCNYTKKTKFLPRDTLNGKPCFWTEDRHYRSFCANCGNSHILSSIPPNSQLVKSPFDVDECKAHFPDKNGVINHIGDCQKIKRIELGCGKTPRDGYDGIDEQDFGQLYKADVLAVLTKFKDNSVDEIYASHFFEHLYPDKVIDTLIQVYRVLKINGQLWIIVPHKEHERANVLWHRTFFTEFTFSDYFRNDKWQIIELVTNSRKDIHCKVIKL